MRPRNGEALDSQWMRMNLSIGVHKALLHREALYQGMASAWLKPASAVPDDREKGLGFSP
ncbi:MAG: hypothetical protein ABSE42_21670 [Bryobacteraceae bacterium]